VTLRPSLWFALAIVWLALVAAASGCSPPVTVTTDAKPGQAQAVAIALDVYGASEAPPIAWAEDWQLTCDNGQGFRDPRVGNDCLGGTHDPNNGQVWVAWPSTATHVRDVALSLSHELAHVVLDLDGHEHAWFLAGGAVDVAAAAIRGMR
jgi:hypothetical protein